MWSFFSRDPSKDFAFEIGDKVPGLEECSIWTLHEGKKKATGEPVSVFVFDPKNSNEGQFQLAKASHKKIKTLRHPNILTYLDGLENEKVIYIVTEPVTPLETWLRNNSKTTNQTNLAISWNIHQIAKGLSFLVNDCKLIHNNVCISSIFVDRAGEWRIGGLDYMYPTSGPDSFPPIKILPALQKYDPPEKTDSSGRGVKAGETWSSDMWGLGCLIWEIFNGPLTKTAALKTFGKIPKSLVPHYCELVGANPKSRPNPADFITRCRARGGYLNNKFVDTVLFLEEIQIKEQNEKGAFYNRLNNDLDAFPLEFCLHRVLPHMLNDFEYGNAGSAVLGPMFKLGKHLDTEEYQKKIVPCVVKLFTSTDRATRVKLLQQIEFFVEHLQVGTVNEQLFPNIVQGFMDTNPVVRESTIKALVHLAPKLNNKNLNEELLKHFARLQTKDDQGGIRTNTTVCLGKIAPCLNPQMRQKVLVSAYLRAVKDPFPPARQAGILAMAASHQYFTLRESATRLLPTLCSLSMDPDKAVRDQSFKAIKCFLGKLEKVSENPELSEEMEKDVMSGNAGSNTAAGWAGWAFTGMTNLTSKFVKGKTKAPQSKGPSAQSETTADSKDSTNKTDSVSQSAKPEETSTLPGEKEEQQNDNDGWEEEEWGDMEDLQIENESSQQKASTAQPGDGWDNDEDDDWGSLENTSSKTTHSKPSTKGSSSASWGADDFSSSGTGFATTSSYGWDQEESTNQDDFFSSMISQNKKKTKSMAQNKTELSKKKREERKAQRQKELEEKRAARQTAGAMKLGTKKTVDAWDSWE